MSENKRYSAELGPRMIGKLCDDGNAVERALVTIRGEVGSDPENENK